MRNQDNLTSINNETKEAIIELDPPTDPEERKIYDSLQKEKPMKAGELDGISDDR